MKRLMTILLILCTLLSTCTVDAESGTEILFFDSFDNKATSGSLWRSEAGNVDIKGCISDSSGVSKAEFKYNDNAIHSVIAGESTWSDYTLSVDMCFLELGIAGMFFRYESNTKHYLLQYSDSKLNLSKRDNSNKYQNIISEEFQLSPGKIVRIKIVANGDQIDIYADGEKLISVTDSSLPSGKIGLRTYSGHVSFDNIAVYTGDTEPRVLPIKPDSYYEPVDVSGINKFYYVSPDGDDSNDGSIDAPFKSIGKARNVIKASGVPDGGVMVYLRGGEYYLEDGEYFYEGSGGREGSPVVYSSYPGEHASLTGALRFEEDGLVEIPDEVIDKLPIPNGVLAFDLAKMGITQIDDRTVESNYYSLFYDDVELTPARWPNNDWARTGKIMERGSRPGFGETDDRGFEFLLLEPRPQRWTNDGNIWMYGAWSREWKYTNVQVAEFSNNAGSVITVQPSTYGAEQGMPYYYYNVLEELDTPGEWYIDKSRGMIYVYPPDNADINGFSLSTSKNSLLRIANTQNIVFQNLDIKFGRSNGVDISTSNNIVLQGCRVFGFSQTGVTIKGRNCGFLNGEIRNNGSSGIFVTSTTADRKLLDNSRNFCVNSFISDCGKNDNSYVAIVSGMGNMFVNNYVSDGNNGGILFGGNENTIAYNEVSDVCKLVNDGGAIYATGRDFTQRGNKVMYNYIHDVNGSSRKNLVGPSGIYLDAMMSGTKVYGNTIVRTTLPILMGGGRDNEIVNNFFLQSTENSTYSIVADQRGVDTSEYEDQGTVWDRVVSSLQTSYDSMPCTSDVWAEKYPTLANVWDDEPRLPKYNIITDNFVYSHEEPQIAEMVAECGTVSENIEISDTNGFVGYETDDYSLDIESDFYNQSETLRNTSFKEVGLSSDHKVGDFYLLYPYDDTVIRNKDCFLSWSNASGADAYRVEVARDAAFEDVVLDDETNETFYMLPEQESDTKFYWRVTACPDSESFGNINKTSCVKSFYTMTDRELLDEMLADAKELFNTAVNMDPLPMDRVELNKFRAAIDDAEKSSGTGNDGELRQMLAGATSDFCESYSAQMAPFYSFRDDFNNLDVGDSPAYDDVRGGVESVQLSPGDNALLLRDDSSAIYPVLIKQTEPITGVGRFSFRIMPGQRNGFVYVKLRQVTSTTYFDPIVFVIQDGGMMVNNTSMCAFQANVWYKVDVDVDAEKKIFSVSVNGVEKITDMPFEGADFINAIVFTGNTYTGYNYLDDIVVEVYSGELKPVYDPEMLSNMCSFECIVLNNRHILNLSENEISGTRYTASYKPDGQLLNVLSTPLSIAPGGTAEPEPITEDCRIMFWNDKCLPLSAVKDFVGLP